MEAYTSIQGCVLVNFNSVWNPRETYLTLDNMKLYLAARNIYTFGSCECVYKGSGDI